MSLLMLEKDELKIIQHVLENYISQNGIHNNYEKANLIEKLEFIIDHIEKHLKTKKFEEWFLCIK